MNLPFVHSAKHVRSPTLILFLFFFITLQPKVE